VHRPPPEGTRKLVDGGVSLGKAGDGALQQRGASNGLGRRARREGCGCAVNAKEVPNSPRCGSCRVGAVGVGGEYWGGC
jgi:hypothetical protein